MPPGPTLLLGGFQELPQVNHGDKTKLRTGWGCPAPEEGFALGQGWAPLVLAVVREGVSVVLWDWLSPYLSLQERPRVNRWGKDGEAMGLLGRWTCSRDHSLESETGVSTQGVRNLSPSSQEVLGLQHPENQKISISQRGPLVFRT